MAVPTSGAISMLGLAQEAFYGTYGTGVIAEPIHLYDLVNGGDSAGSGDDYPTVNSGCTPNPITRGSTALLQMYKYQEGQTAIGPITLYVSSNEAATASDLTAGDILFTDSSLQTLFGQWETIGDGDFKSLYQSETNLTTDQKICGLGSGCNFFSTNSFSAIKDLICGCP